MKKYFLALIFLLFSISGIAQKKKKRDAALPPPVPAERVAPKFEKQEAGNNQDGEEYLYLIPETMGNSETINITKTNGEKIRLNAFKDLKKINLSELKSLSLEANYSSTNTRLEARFLQEILEKGSQLESLVIHNFEIENFPEIKKPNNVLKKLELDNNKLKMLSPSISNLVALEDFSSYNPLQELPETFSQLKNLKKLSLERTEFSAFPKVIFGLNDLFVLHISGNYQRNAQIKEIPDLFTQLPELKEFKVALSSLSTLPKSISTLKKLEKVVFSDNQFNDFPEALASNPNLKYVAIDYDPLDWDKFTASIKKMKWGGVLSLYKTGFSKKQYEEIQKMLPQIDVYYKGMND